MESESQASITRRRMRSLRRFGLEFALAGAFVIAVLWGHETVDRHSSSYLRCIAILLPVFVLTLWWSFYSAHIKGLEEFEQTIATRSIAIACAITLWIITALGLATIYMDLQTLPLVMVAPLAAFVYAIIRAVFMLKYR